MPAIMIDEVILQTLIKLWLLQGPYADDQVKGPEYYERDVISPPTSSFSCGR